MEKLIYLIGSELPPRELREMLVGTLGTQILDSDDVLELEVYVRDQTGPLLESVENRMDPEGLLSASVSLWIRSIDDRHRIESVLSDVAPRLAGYLVTESVPREYAKRDWADGTMSPTVTIATAFSEKPGLAAETLYERWHGSHTPLSLRIHPLTRYVRNAVARTLTSGAPPYRGLVFESVESLAILADIESWYGSKKGRREAIADLLSFANFETMATVPMSETIVRAAPWRVGGVDGLE